MRSLKKQVAALLFVGVLLVPFAVADDAADVRAVIDAYVATETTDLAKQGGLMTDDRVFIGGGVRLTDNVSNMAAQVAGEKLGRILDPDTKTFVNIEDLMIRLYGEAAVASFYRYWNVIPGVNSVREGRAPQTPPNQVVTLVLAKMGREWKIVHTHSSEMSPAQ